MSCSTTRRATRCSSSSTRTRENRRQRAEGRRQKAEGRRQKTASRRFPQDERYSLTRQIQRSSRRVGATPLRPLRGLFASKVCGCYTRIEWGAAKMMRAIMKKMRMPFWVFLTIVGCASLGRIYGQRVEAAAGDGAVTDSLDAFAKVYAVVQRNYAEPVSPDRAILGVFGPQGNSNVGAISGMLRTLDPHSNFFDSKTFARLRETQEGKYYGVGMRILTVPGNHGGLLQAAVDG